jgi:hypothetical protein
MLGFILLIVLFAGIWSAMFAAADVAEISKNWTKYRCQPNIMPFAAFYGHDTAENFQFCLNTSFSFNANGLIAPIVAVITNLMVALSTMIESINSIRLLFATFMGSVTSLFSAFSQRIQHMMSAASMSAIRIKFLMGRLYGAFFAIIFMAITGVTALQNFTDGVLFSFLDTFCFDPDTLVQIEGKGLTKVKDVKIGDVFTKTKSKVTATFAFESDGQPMVTFPGEIVVSTNHYVWNGTTFCQAGDHPDAKPVGPWSGGIKRPLICFNTSDHKLPVGNYLFLDYDETEEGDEETMRWIDKGLNAVPNTKDRTFAYTSALHPKTKIQRPTQTSVPLSSIRLGDQISTGRVIGVIQKEVSESCTLATGEEMGPGTSFWDGTQWIRAADTGFCNPLSAPSVYISLVVLKTASIETESGTMIRDYVEIHSPEAEQFYGKAISSASWVLAE